MTARGQGQGYTMAAGGHGLMKAGAGEELDYDSRRAGAGRHHGRRRAGIQKGRMDLGTRCYQQYCRNK